MSYKYRYSLNKECMQDLQLEAAYADKSLKKKMMIYLINFLCIPSVLIIILMDRKVFALLIAGLYFFLCLILFPSVYWNRIRKVIKRELDRTDFKFEELFVEFTEQHVSIMQKNQRFLISYSQVEGYKITNHNFMMYYRKEDRNDCLIIPYSIIEKELDSIIGLIKSKAKMQEG